MQRFNIWEQKMSPDFWRDRFKPKDILRVTAHAHSVLSMRYDAKLLERYDINDVDTHSVGATYTWVPVEFGEPTYLEGEDYPWAYEIDENWLWVDAIYDKHVDPDHELQNTIDFILKKGVIQFVYELPKIPLYIAKGRYAKYRIYNEIGCLLDYKRKDSTRYRDTIAPILAAFYKGPSPERLVAVLNVVAGIPVAKFGNETVISTRDNIVETDKYSYPMGNVQISVKEGDVLTQFQPLSNAVELITHKTHPQWWEDRPVELFAKYCIDTTMNEALRNYVMEYFLKDTVAYIRFKLDYQDLSSFSENRDVIDIFLDALPTRTDVFMGQSSDWQSLVDKDNDYMTPDISKMDTKMGIRSVRGLTKIDSEMFQYAPDTGRPIFTNNVLDQYALTLNDYSWHIFGPDETDNMREFWKTSPRGASTFEPYLSRVYLRLTDTAPWEHSEIHVGSMEMPADISDFGVRLNIRGNDSSGIYSKIPFDIADNAPKIQAIQAEVVNGILEMDTWELDNLIFAKDGLVVYDGVKGTAITHPFFLGNLPKNVFIRTEFDLPENTLIDIRYSLDKTTWLEVPDVIKQVSGNIYVKITLYASVQKSPTFRRLYINLTAN